MADLGANSVDRAEIIMMTLEALSLQIPSIELSEARNLGGLAEILFEKKATRMLYKQYSLKMSYQFFLLITLI